ncbi:MAG: hypothetical protein HYS27_23475 [Deltaproteobacteria bacterium]|nr:hypothetical protein [Deltaproteobacteria bacterium]
MKIEADARVAFPRAIAFHTYRDELQNLVPHLPNVRSIEVKESEDAPGGVASRTRKLNLWRAKADIPAAAQRLIKPEMLAWDDHALWDEADWTCEWRVVPHFFGDRIRCSGKNRYLVDGEHTILQIRGDLTVDANGLPGVPRLIAGTVAAAIERFVVALLTPNLTSVSKGLEAYLRSKQAS